MKRKLALQQWPPSKDSPGCANSGPAKPSLMHSACEQPGWGLIEKRQGATGQVARA